MLFVEELKNFYDSPYIDHHKAWIGDSSITLLFEQMLLVLSVSDEVALVSKNRFINKQMFSVMENKKSNYFFFWFSLFRSSS